MTSEQQLLTARLEDHLRLARKRPCFLGFLDEAQAAFCQDYLAHRREAAILYWGGHENAERVMLGFFPGSSLFSHCAPGTHLPQRR